MLVTRSTQLSNEYARVAALDEGQHQFSSFRQLQLVNLKLADIWQKGCKSLDEELRIECYYPANQIITGFCQEVCS